MKVYIVKSYYRQEIKKVFFSKEKAAAYVSKQKKEVKEYEKKRAKLNKKIIAWEDENQKVPYFQFPIKRAEYEALLRKELDLYIDTSPDEYFFEEYDIE